MLACFPSRAFRSGHLVQGAGLLGHSKVELVTASPALTIPCPRFRPDSVKVKGAASIGAG